MVGNYKSSERQEYKQKLDQDYMNTIGKEIRDYIRNGDVVILKRVLLKLFVHSDVPDKLKRQKACSLMSLLMNHHHDFQMTLSIQTVNN